MIRRVRAAKVVGAAGQCGRDPQQPTGRVRHHLHVHPASAVLVGEVGPAIAGPVALRQGAAGQDVVVIGFAQGLSSPGRAAGERPITAAVQACAVPVEMPTRVSCLRR